MFRPGSGFRCAAAAMPAKHTGRSARLLGQLALTVGLEATHFAAVALETPAVFSVDAGVAATDNGGLAGSGEGRPDVIASIRPDLRWKRRGPGLDVDLEAAVTFLGHTNATKHGSILPDLRASLRSTLVDRWLFVDAEARVKDSEADAYGPRTDVLRDGKRRSEGTYSVRPRLERLIAPDTLLVGAYDVALTTNGAGSGARGVSRRGLARLERFPVPIGGSLEWSRIDSETHRAERSRLAAETLRLAGDAAFSDEWVLGVVVGQDRSQFLGSGHTDPLYGVELKWNPSSRTSVVAAVERRFFGVGGAVRASHRTPYLSMGLDLSRQPALSSLALRTSTSAGDLRSYLDAILTTRYPNVGLRELAVDRLVRDHGLDSRALTASTIVADYPQVQTSATAHLALLGRRDAVTVTVYVQSARLMTHGDDPVKAVGAVSEDNRQVGASVQWSHRLGPQLSADAVVRRSRIAGLADRKNDLSNEILYRVGLLRRVTDQYAVSASIQHNRFDTNVASRTSFQATTLMLGASYRF